MTPVFVPGAPTPGLVLPWMWAMETGVVSPEKVMLKLKVVRSGEMLNVPLPVAVLRFAGTSWEPLRVTGTVNWAKAGSARSARDAKSVLMVMAHPS
jgi:hypothetical protein